MSEKFPVFRIQLEKFDLLFAASDFYHIYTQSQWEEQENGIKIEDSLVFKGIKHRLITLDFFRVGYATPFSCKEICHGHEKENTAFLGHTKNGTAIALIIQEDYELCDYALEEFKLFPLCLRKLMKLGHGLIAIRFEKNERPQYLVCFSI